jgi:hypothetical protein
VPTGADITLAVMAEIETLAATVTVPRVVTVTAQITAQEVALGEIWNVFAAGLHTYVGVVARDAAFVGHPVPEMVRVLPLVEKYSCVPVASVPMLVAVKVGVDIPVTGYVVAPTTQ